MISFEIFIPHSIFQHIYFVFCVQVVAVGHFLCDMPILFCDANTFFFVKIAYPNCNSHTPFSAVYTIWPFSHALFSHIFQWSHYLYLLFLGIVLDHGRFERNKPLSFMYSKFLILDSQKSGKLERFLCLCLCCCWQRLRAVRPWYGAWRVYTKLKLKVVHDMCVVTVHISKQRQQQQSL